MDAQGQSSRTASLRNVGICAHIDAGKTTLTERILHTTGVERHVGRVDEGTAVMDWMAEERERGITITAAATRVPWAGAEINLVDTPGHVDFTVEVERCMRVLDGAVVVLDATKGVEPQTETVWRQVDRRSLPAIAFANKCERAGADVLACAEAIGERLGRRSVVVAYPIGGGDSDAPLTGVVDLVHMRAHGLDTAGQRVTTDVPASVAEEAGVLRAELVDALGDLDETLFEIICEGRTPTGDEVERALRTQVRARALVPLFSGAALIGHGVALLLDGVASLLPAPHEAPRPELFDVETGERYTGPTPELLALTFKVHSKVRRGERSDLTFVRLYAGEVGPGSRLWNGRTGRMEEVAAVLRIHSSEVEHLDGASAGDVVALSGLKGTGTGDTLTVEGASARLEPPRVPTPVLGFVLEPRTDEDRQTLGEALDQLGREDPSLAVGDDSATGQWLLQGMGELHLEIALARLRDEFGVEPRVGPPQVAILESVRAPAQGIGAVDRAYGDDWGAAEVGLALEPTDDASAPCRVRFDGSAAALPKGLQDAIEEGLLAEALSGPRAGHPVVGAVLVATSASGSRGDAPEAAWVQAAIAGLREALRAASAAGGVRLMEPWMRFVVDTPVDVSGGVIGDLNSRHATMDEIVSTGRVGRRVTGSAPLRSLIGYSTELRSLSKGRATFSLRPRGHDFAVGPEGAVAQ